jgi:hypothetical protein
MKPIIDTAAVGQGCTPQNTPQANLEQLAAAVKTAQAGIAAGRALMRDDELVPHGEWRKFLKDECDLLPRQAQRYMRLAPHYDAANATCKSHLVSPSIEAAFKQLSAPEKGTHRREVKTTPRREHNVPTPTGLNVHDLWNRTTLTERTRFLSNVGPKLLAQALPRDWNGGPPTIAYVGKRDIVAFDPIADVWASINEAYRNIRARQRGGGPGWSLSNLHKIIDVQRGSRTESWFVVYTNGRIKYHIKNDGHRFLRNEQKPATSGSISTSSRTTGHNCQQG